MSRRSKCPTCNSDVVIGGSDEGTRFYVPANATEHTEAVLEVQRMRGAIPLLQWIRGMCTDEISYIEVDAVLVRALDVLEAEA